MIDRYIVDLYFFVDKFEAEAFNCASVRRDKPRPPRCQMQ